MLTLKRLNSALIAIFCSPVEEQIEQPTHTEVSIPVSANTEPSVASQQPVPQAVPLEAAPAAGVEGVDLSKIGSILNSLNSVMKNTGECW